eukprot:g2112.t1
MHTLRCRSIFCECQQRFMYTVDKLHHRTAHLYKRHKQRGPCMLTLRCRNIFRFRQRFLLHCVVQLRSGPKDRRQRHKQHRPCLCIMSDWEILYCVQPERLRELDHMQHYHRSGKQRRVYDSG